MLPLRVVFDTNVLVAKLLFDPRSSWLPRAWQDGRLIPLATEETIQELIEILNRVKFHLAADEVEKRIAEYRPWCQIYPEDAAIPVPECRDPDDRKFLQLALQAQADALVTEDQDLLTLQDAFPIPIIPLDRLQALLPAAPRG